MDPNNKNNKKINIINLIPFIITTIFLVMLLVRNPLSSLNTSLNYTEFEKLIETNEITDINFSVDYNTVYVSGKYAENNQTRTFDVTIANWDSVSDEVLSKIENKNITVTYSDANESNIWLTLLSSLLPLGLMIAIAIIFFSKMSGQVGSNAKAFEFSKSPARLQKDIKTRFSDVAGADEEKEEMAELIDYLKSPRKFATMGARIPKGIILVGPPGTGKTLLAKAVAGEAGVPFYSISGSDFVEMFVGVGASRVRDMFKTAKKNAPCLIFIDEIDAVGRQRGAGMGGGHDEREQTLNQLLVELDGMSDNSGVIVIAATNRPDVLDSALLRPGRFDRQITVSLPDLKAREEILMTHARNKKLASDVDIKVLAKRTPGFSGADLENVLNEAAILTIRFNKTEIDLPTLDEAIDRVMMGPAKKSKKYDEHTKKLVAYHEAGHAIVGLNLPEGQIVQKVTIIPRGNAGGYNLFTPKHEKILNSKNELLDNITSLMGGRSAEEIFFDDVTTGASNDIQQATRTAKDMVKVYGMSELGPVQYDSGSGSVFLGRDYNAPSDASSQIAYEIDVEVRKIIDECHEKAKKIINEHKDDLIKIAEALIANETLTSEEIDKILKNELVVENGELVDVSQKETVTDINNEE